MKTIALTIAAAAATLVAIAEPAMVLDEGINNLRRLDEMPSHQQHQMPSETYQQRPGDNHEQFGWGPGFYGGGFYGRGFYGGGFPYGGYYY